MRPVLLAALVALALPVLPALPAAQDAYPAPEPRDGWAVHDSALDFDTLVAAVKTEAATQQLGVVTEAGPTGMAASRGIDIPGNRVIGLFNNDYAVRILGLSTAAMIEAPVRMYVTEDPDGSATLSYKTPSHVFAPYLDEAGPDLAAAAAELDAKFDAVAQAAIQ
jgi:uncharacterized protein (DUF302 family)